MRRLVLVMLAGGAVTAARAELREQDLLASVDAESQEARAWRVYRQTFEGQYRAEDYPILELGLEAKDLVSVTGRVLWNEHQETVGTAGSSGLVPPAPRAAPVWVRGAGRASFRRRVVPGETAFIWIDLRRANETIPFDGYRGWIRSLTLVLERPSSNVRVVQVRLHPPSRTARRAVLRQLVHDPRRIHPNYLVLLGVVPLAVLLRATGRDGRRAVVEALLVAWILGAASVALRRLGAVPALVETLVSVPPDRLGELRNEGGRTRRTAAALQKLLPVRAEVGFFDRSAHSAANALQLELPLYTFAPGRTDLPFQVHGDTSQLPALVQEAGDPFWASIARRRPLTQTFGVPTPVEAVALQVTLDQAPPGGAELEARVRRGQTGALVGSGRWEEGGPIRMHPALRLCPGETYLLELDLLRAAVPVRVLASRGDAYPEGAARGDGLGDAADLKWRFLLSPSGTLLLGATEDGHFVFRKGDLGPCGSSQGP